MSRTARARPAGSVSLAALAVAACATPLLDGGEPMAVVGHAVPPFGSHEECARLAPNDRLDYRFAATEPVAFEIRYRVGNAVVAPIAHEATRGDAGLFAAPLVQDYCLWWEAGPAGAVLDYRVRVRRAGS